MLTCIILCKGFFQGSRLMQRFLPGFRLMQSPQIPVPERTGSSRLRHPAPTVSSVCRRPGQQGFFHGDGLLRTHLLTAVTLDALAVIILLPCRRSLLWPCLLPGRHAHKSRSPHIFPASPPASFPGTASKNGPALKLHEIPCSAAR